MDFVSPVLNLIGSQLLAEYAQINGISGKLDAWGRKLRMIQAVMDSAEDKQMNGNPAVDQWLSDLRDVAYDMEDLLDHFSVDAKRNASKARDLSRSSKLPYSLISCCSSLRPRSLISSHCMANDIDEVDRRLQDVIRDIEILGFVQNHRCGSPSPANIGHERSFTSSLPEPKVVGREEQMEELLARLTGSEATNNPVRPFTVVSIVGMGGLGKTTMAQQLYSHESLNKESFPFKAWVCVSDVFDRVAITKSILDQVAPFSSGMENDLNKLQNLLKDKLSGKKFFIVLDDVWNDRYDELESLLRPLYSGGKGSNILLTTRNLQVAKLVGDHDPRRLDVLSPEESLCLLAYHSIREENFERHTHLQDVAVQLVAKCKGLPLSIKAIGGLLRRLERDDETWKKVLADSIWNKEDEPETIPRALKLSYVHLPLHLKRCFAACALFPKDYIFNQDEVIRVWTVQGLLHKGTAKTYRDAGTENLRHLESVSLIEKAKDGKTSYTMHDLFNDLAKSIMAGVYFSSDESKEGPVQEGSLGKVRHAMMVAQEFETFLPSRFDLYRSMKRLRTFILSPMSGFDFAYVTVPRNVIHDLIMDKKNLRMLSLRCLAISKVPDRIGELKLLRSIDLSHTFIEALPESICDLVELQSLLLRCCRSLKKLPSNIHKLTKLLHLDITGTRDLMEMPPHIGDLTNLEILSDFIVGKEAGLELKNLGPLKCLQRELHLRNLLAVHDAEDARIAKLHEKEAILELSFDWRSSSETASENDHHLEVLEHLQPPKKVESLTIHGYGGKMFPSWFGNPCMNNVASITLTGCKSVLSLPSFGRLPSLESLDISDLKAVSSIGEEFYGAERPFQSLKILRFENMGALEKWTSGGCHEKDKPFPRLRELKVKKCPNLSECPTLSLASVVEIDIDGCSEGLLKCLVDLTSMTKMNIRKVPELVHFDGRFSTSWVALKEMSIKHCPQFKSFEDEDAGKRVSHEFKNLEKLPDDLSGLASPSETSAGDCGNLTSFPSSELPPALRKLTLRRCPNLPSQLICNKLPESLEELYLKRLEGLVSITGLPAEGTRICRSLSVVEIRNCSSVTALPDSLQHLSALSKLVLKHFPALEIDCFPALPCNLSSFVLKSCPKVKSLPHDMHTLTSLKELSINYCDGITRLPSGGLPPNLEVLTIRVCRKLSQRIEDWGLCRLAALRELRLCGEMECVNEIECFPPSLCAWSSLLPPSLAKLVLQKMKKLERVGGGLNLTSLRDLWISECPRMRYLPDDGMPSSLGRLGILGCPLMKKRLSKYMPMIQHIPDLDISYSPDTSVPTSGASTPCSPDSIDSSYFSDGIIVL